jgi:hypothetical protein
MDYVDWVGTLFGWLYDEWEHRDAKRFRMGGG